MVTTYQSPIEARHVHGSQTKNLNTYLLDVLPGYALVLNTRDKMLSLVSLTIGGVPGGNPLLLQQRLTRNEMHVLVCLLGFPEGCPYEQLLASIRCTTREWQENFCLCTGPAEAYLEQIERWKRHLVLAEQEGTKGKELNAVHDAISGLRQKLRGFGLRIRPYDPDAGYSLISVSPKIPAMEQNAAGPALASTGRGDQSAH